MSEQKTDIELLFIYIRSHKWNKFKKLLQSGVAIDLNLKDGESNYLLTYAVKFNRNDIVSLLFKHGAKYDIVDEKNRCLLYDAIRYNYYDIVCTILETSKVNVGISIIDIQDFDGYIPLHYAIIYNNDKIAKLLINSKSNLALYDNTGKTALHMAVKNNQLNIVNEIINIITNINIKTRNGCTPLHIAINYQFINIITTLIQHKAYINALDNNDFSPLHYAVSWNNVEITKLLVDNNANPNIQDIYGNTPLLYCIKDNYEQCFDYIYSYFNDNIHVNAWNIEGKTILHEVFDKYDDSKKKYVDILIKNTNLNLQDINGNTCMHHIILYNLWHEYKNILKTKKINIFAVNYLGKAVIDLIYADKQDTKYTQYCDFLDIITNSYMYILKKTTNWKDELDNICSRELNILTENEKNIINNTSNIQHDCYTLIRNKLENHIKSYYDATLVYCQRSYPIKNHITIQNNACVDVCTYTGTILDVLIGLIYLIKKHPNACTTIGQHVSLNDGLCNFYKSMGIIMNGMCEFINFEIVWIEFKLYMLDNFSVLFNNCIKSKARFVIVPVGIELKNGSHANYLVYDKIVKEVERFEPHGSSVPIGFNYNSHQLDNILEEYFKSIDNDITYIKPSDYLPKIGFQILESNEITKIRIGDPGGFCALWAVWYVDQRLTYHMLSRTELVKKLFTSIREQHISYKNMIRNYSQSIIKERDKLLKSVGITINDWINNNYTHIQSNTFIQHLINKINKCCTYK